MTKSNPKTINGHLTAKYGAEGTAERIEFNINAQSFMIAELVKSARKAAKLTQEQLAEKANVKRPHISRIERGKGDFRISTLQKIAEGLGGNLRISLDL